MSVGFPVPRDVFLTDRWEYLGPSERHFLQQIATDYSQRVARYEAAWKAYRGDMPLPLKATKTDKKGEDNVLVPNPTLVVDTIVANLFGERAAPTFEIETDSEGDEPATRSPEETWLAGFWKANKKLVLLNKAGTNGAVFGHCYIRLSEPTPVTRGFPRLAVVDPQEMIVITHPDDIEHVLEYIQVWSYTDQRGQPVWRRQRHVEEPNRLVWTIHDEVLTANEQGWQPIKPPQTWPHAWSQIHDCQHLPLPNMYYGRSELESYQLGVARSVNFNYSNTNRILRNHGHPKTYATGFGGKELVSDPDTIIILPDPQAKLANLEMQSDLKGAHDQADRVEDVFYRTARVPRIALGVLGEASNLSAVALAVRFRPLEDKIGVLRSMYGLLLSAINEHVLEYADRGTHEVRNVWPQILPKDALQERQVAQMDQQLGVSRRTTLTQLGYDAEREENRRQDEEPVIPAGPAGVSGRPDVSPQPRKPSTS